MTKREISKILRQLEKERRKNNSNWIRLFYLLYGVDKAQLKRDYGLADEFEIYEFDCQRRAANKKINAMLETLLTKEPETTREIITAICKQDRIITATARRLAK